MPRLSGRCLCSAVIWQTGAPVLWSGFCHCESCRRACSAPFTGFFGVARESVTWAGEIPSYTSSPGVRRGFCGSCGSQLFYQSDRWPNETHLYIASLDDPASVPARAHFHWAERLSGIEINDDLPKYPGTAGNSGAD